jgi:hypothetical protein
MRYCGILTKLDNREKDQNYTFYRWIQEHKVKEMSERFDNSKVVGPNNMPVEVWKGLGDKVISLLTKLLMNV